MLEMGITYTGTKSVYVIIRRTTDAAVYSPGLGAFTVWIDAGLDGFDIPLIDQGGDLWAEDAPSALISGVSYRWVYYELDGASPSVNDLLLDSEEGTWTGSTLDVSALTCTDGLTYFDLRCLLEWTRRRAADTGINVREEQEADGTDTIILDNEGTVTLLSATNEGVAVDITTITVFENVLTFPSALSSGNTVVVKYQYTGYSDDDLVDHMEDISHQVSADLGKLWLVNTSNHRLEKLVANMFDANGQFKYLLRKIIVMGAAIAVFEDKTASLTGDAIKIRDGDTQIDTSPASQGNTKLLTRLNEQFDAHMLEAKNRCFRGLAIRGDWNCAETLTVADENASS